VTRPAYKIELEPRARKRLALLDGPIRRRVATSIDKLSLQPRPSGAVGLTGRSGVLRIRSGDYRILYEIRDDQLVILIIDVGHRREIYR
jgi:mRNA interferase RelE/StbE